MRFHRSSLAFVRTVAAAIALAAGAVAPLEAGMRITLEPGLWNQLVFPGAVDDRPIRALFDDPALEPSAYGRKWIVYTYDSDTGTYVDPGIDGTLEEGTGFWFMQTTGNDVTLDSADVPYALGSPDPACASADGCSAKALPDPEDRYAWSMAGNPFEHPVATRDARIGNAGGNAPCDDGCSLGQAADEGIIGPVLWSYDATAETYVPVSDASLPVWAGFWVASGSTSATPATRLLIPDPFCS